MQQSIDFVLKVGNLNRKCSNRLGLVLTLNVCWQGRREGGRGGNFYRGPDLKRRAHESKIYLFFETYFKILPGPRVKSTVLSTALSAERIRW